MTDTRSATTTRTGKPGGSRWTRIAFGVAAIAILGLSGGKFMSRWLIPSCDKSSIQATIREIFESQNVVLTVFNEIAELSATDDRKMCTAHIESADEVGTIEYSIVWQWWSPYVTIEKVDAKPRGSDTGTEGGETDGGGKTGGSIESPTGIDTTGAGADTATETGGAVGGETSSETTTTDSNTPGGSQ